MFLQLDLTTVDIDVIVSKLASKDISFIAKREVDAQQTVAFFTGRTISNVNFLIELKFKAGMNISKVTVRSPNKVLSDACKSLVSKILQSH